MKFTDYQPIDISACRADEIAPISKHMDASAPEIWISLAEMLYLTLRANPALAGVSDDALGLCATQALYQIAMDFGGDTVYLRLFVKACGRQQWADVCHASQKSQNNVASIVASLYSYAIENRKFLLCRR